MKTQNFWLLLLTLIPCSIPNIIIAQENSPSLNQPSATSESVRQSRIIREREKSSIIEAIWKLLKAKREIEPPLASRSNICEITGLLGKNNLIYSDRPLFIWQGQVNNLKVNLYTPFSLDTEQEIFWTKAIKNKSQNLLYTGEPLQPGKTYDWEIVTYSPTKRRRISFTVINGEKRDRISQELAQLETNLTISGATPEAIILAKAEYFAQQDLWSDSLQQLYSLEPSSDSAIASNQVMMSYICQSE